MPSDNADFDSDETRLALSEFMAACRLERDRAAQARLNLDERRLRAGDTLALRARSMTECLIESFQRPAPLLSSAPLASELVPAPVAEASGDHGR